MHPVFTNHKLHQISLSNISPQPPDPLLSFGSVNLCLMRVQVETTSIAQHIFSTKRSWLPQIKEEELNKFMTGNFAKT